MESRIPPTPQSADARDDRRDDRQWLPLSDPAFANPELRRINRIVLPVVGTIYIAVIAVLALVVRPAPDLWLAGPFLAAISFAPLIAVLTFWLMRRRLWPAARTILWLNARTARAWDELDGGAVPKDADEALSRLTGRSDDDATAARLAWLANANRIDELREGLDAWRPTDPVARASRARHEGALRLLEDGTDYLTAARAAASAILDPERRTEAQAIILFEEGRRRADMGKDPFPALIEADRLLGPRAVRLETEEVRREQRAFLRQLVLWVALPGAVVTLFWLAALTGLVVPAAIVVVTAFAVRFVRA